MTDANNDPAAEEAEALPEIKAAPSPADKRSKAATPAKGKGKPAAAPAASPAVNGPLMTVIVRNEFHRDGFRNMMRIAIAESIIIVVLLLSFISYMNTVKAKDRYFATTADG